MTLRFRRADGACVDKSRSLPYTGKRCETKPELFRSSYDFQYFLPCLCRPVVARLFLREKMRAWCIAER